jgi:NADPH:quinone reductase-like Zn-dependent oxidoreductase
MSLPTTQKQWVVEGTDKDLDGVQYKDGPVPKVGANDVLVKLRGASLNYRDLLIPKVCLSSYQPPFHPRHEI